MFNWCLLIECRSSHSFLVPMDVRVWVGEGEEWLSSITHSHPHPSRQTALLIESYSLFYQRRLHLFITSKHFKQEERRMNRRSAGGVNNVRMTLCFSSSPWMKDNNAIRDSFFYKGKKAFHRHVRETKVKFCVVSREYNGKPCKCCIAFEQRRDLMLIWRPQWNKCRKLFYLVFQTTF